MTARLIAAFFFGYFSLGLLVSNGIVSKDDLLARWSFDEGNGTVSQDLTGSGVDAIFKNGATWASGDNAMSQGSLDLTSGDGYALVASHSKHSGKNWFFILSMV
jgi:hypothetical protein